MVVKDDAPLPHSCSDLMVSLRQRLEFSTTPHLDADARARLPRRLPFKFESGTWKSSFAWSQRQNQNAPYYYGSSGHHWVLLPNPHLVLRGTFV
jgi:hypothetical protein